MLPEAAPRPVEVVLAGEVRVHVPLVVARVVLGAVRVQQTVHQHRGVREGVVGVLRMNARV